MLTLLKMFYVNNEAAINKLLVALVFTFIGALGHRYGFDPRVVENVVERSIDTSTTK